MNRRHALHILTGGALTVAGCSSFAGDTTDGPATNDDAAPYSDGLIPESSNDPSMATLRLVAAGGERVDLGVEVTKPNGDRQFEDVYAVTPDEDVVFHDVLALDEDGEATFDVVVRDPDDIEVITESTVSLDRTDEQQEVVVTARSTADVTVSTGVVAPRE